MDPVGQKISRYELVDRLTAGGMGEIFLARDPAIERTVVIKFLQDRLDSDDARRRFIQEGQATGRLRHKNIVTVFDVGEWEGRPWIAMEFIVGETLAQKIARQAPMAMPRKLRYMEELCAGLAYAHRRGIVHRDVKPANIMIDDEDLVKILDFGIAHSGESNVTEAGAFVGTPNYMAPEQASERPVDSRTDVFAVGTVFYELLTYQRAFPGALAAAVRRIVYEDPEPLMKLVPDLDPKIEKIVMRALAKDPGERYQDLRMMAGHIAAVRYRVEPPPAATTLLRQPFNADAALFETGALSKSGQLGKTAAVDETEELPKQEAKRTSRRWQYAAGGLALAAVGVLTVFLDKDTTTGSTPQTSPVVQQAAPPVSVAPSPSPPVLSILSTTSTPISETRVTMPSAPVSQKPVAAPSPPPATSSIAPAATARPQIDVTPVTTSTAVPPPPVTSIPGPTTTSSVNATPPVTSPAPPANAPPSERSASTSSEVPAQLPTPQVNDQTAIEQVLNEYRSAYEALDINRVLRVYPSLPNADALRTAFADAREVLIGFTRPVIRITSPTTAVATCKRTQTFVPRVGTGKSATTNATFELRKEEGRWVIASVR